MSEPAQREIDAILAEERELLDKRRDKEDKADPLVGLAMSGGGIRSATFNLGILRVLEKHGFLSLADYVSTVSGGGYIGSYFIANRMRGRKLDKDESDAPPDEVKPLDHLRKYGNFLTPAMGILSVDTWSMLMVWFRNTSVMQAFLLCTIALILLLPRLWGALLRIHLFNGTDGLETWGVPISIGIFHVVTLIICRLLIANFDGVEHFSDFPHAWRRWSGFGARAEQISPQANRWRLIAIIGFALVAATCFALGGFTAFAQQGHAFAVLKMQFGLTLGVAGYFLALFSLGFGRGIKAPRAVEILMLFVYAGLATALTAGKLPGVDISDASTALKSAALFAGLLTVLGMLFIFHPERKDKLKDICRAVIAGAACGGAALAGISVASLFLSEWAQRATLVLKDHAGLWVASDDIWKYALLSSPGLLATIGLCIVILIAITGRAMPDLVREGWSRLGALIYMKSLALLVVGVIGIYGPLVILWIWDSWNSYVLASGGAATAVLGVLSLLTANSSETDGKKGGFKEILVGAAPVIFIVLLFCGVSLALHLFLVDQALSPVNTACRIVPSTAKLEPCPVCIGLSDTRLKVSIDKTLQACPDCKSNGVWNGPNWPKPDQLIQFHWAFLDASVHGQANLLFEMLAGLSGVFLLLAFRLDVNEFSINRFYRNRLARCFIGAARAGSRNQNPLTGFDDEDDIQMGIVAAYLKKELRNEPDLADKTPIPIINTALNAVGGADAGLSERRAESLFFTPFYAYSESTGRMPVSKISTGTAAGDVTLGSLVAISGAAANPNMGFHTSPTVAFLLTFFNVRLGWWVGVPSRLRCFAGAMKRRFNIAYVIFELFGTADTDDAYVNLSDGGHFENLGLYELVRRKCRLIIVGDGEQDDKYVFESLGGAIRKCRIDFGAEIEIDVSKIRPSKEGEDNPRHWAIGKITYRGEKEPGYILYVKSSYTGREPYDVKQYKFQNKEFPQQSTGDQFFNESQLESYRQLGVHAADELFTALKPAAKTKRSDFVKAAASLYVREQPI